MYIRPWTDRRAEQLPCASKPDDRREELRPFFAEANAAGLYSTRAIAAYFNAIGLTTVTGRPWSFSQVARAQRRLAQTDQQIARGEKPFGMEELRGHVRDAQRSGCTSLREIGAYLNDRGVLTSRGRFWYASGVKMLMDRIASYE